MHIHLKVFLKNNTKKFNRCNLFATAPCPFLYTYNVEILLQCRHWCVLGRAKWYLLHMGIFRYTVGVLLLVISII